MMANSSDASRDDQQVAAEMRVAPTVEPDVEVGTDAHIPPEAAVHAVVHGESPQASPSAASDEAAYQSARAAERAADGLPPAELRVPPTAERSVQVDGGADVPPEAGVTPVTKPGASPGS